MLALGAPAAILYLRLVFGYMNNETRLSYRQSPWLPWSSNTALVLFFVVQIVSARYVQRLLKPYKSFPAIALQYLAVLAFCGLLSVTGAVLLEAVGYNFFLRLRSPRGF